MLIKMTSVEFKDWCKRHGLSVANAAVVLGISRTNAFKYAKGSRPVSKPVAYGAEVIDLLSPEKRAKLIEKRLNPELSQVLT